jgi:hypothetical protein
MGSRKSVFKKAACLRIASTCAGVQVQNAIDVVIAQDSDIHPMTNQICVASHVIPWEQHTAFQTDSQL